MCVLNTMLRNVLAPIFEAPGCMKPVLHSLIMSKIVFSSSWCVFEITIYVHNYFT